MQVRLREHRVNPISGILMTARHTQMMDGGIHDLLSGPQPRDASDGRITRTARVASLWTPVGTTVCGRPAWLA
jgi:hypothetical protein